MNSISDVIDSFGGAATLASEIGESYWLVRKWLDRESIPPKYWAAICKASRLREKKISADDLMRIHAPGSPGGGSGSSRASAG